jgi:hypothetical protein
MAEPAKPAGDAAQTEQEELEALDVERESLLDVVLAKAQKAGIEEKIQRVLVALVYAKAGDGGSAVGNDLGATISRIEAEDEQNGYITGLSMLMPGVCLALLEGPQRVVIGVLRAIQEPESQMRTLTSSMHMFLSCQDTPGRSFPGYWAVPIKVDTAGPAVPDLEQAVNMVPEMCVNLLKFGRTLADMDGVLREDALDNIKVKMEGALPRLQDVLGLTQSNDILTLDDFFDLYYSPAKCLGGPLDSELVWPLPPSLDF